MLNYIGHIAVFLLICIVAYLTWRKDRKGEKKSQKNRLDKLFALAIGGAVLALIFSILNEQEEQKNRNLIAKIDTLQNEVLYQITGGNSYCRLLLVNANTADSSLVFFNNVGEKYPLHRIEARVIELNTLTQENFLDHKDTYIKIGTLEPSTSKQFKEMPVYRLDKEKGVNLNIVFNSSNGWCYQYIRMRYIKGSWTRAEMIDMIGVHIIEIDKDYPVQDQKLAFQ